MKKRSAGKPPLLHWQRQATKDQARRVLDSFLRFLSGMDIPEAQTHFQDVFSKLPPRPPEILQRRFDADSHRKPKGKTKAVISACFRILQTTAIGKTPADSDLDFLTDGLNMRRGTIRLVRGARQPEKTDPMSLTPYDSEGTSSAARACADLIYRYVNLTHVCGPLHAACERCGRLALKGRGGRKFCSKECRDQKWSYAARKKRGFVKT